MGIPYTYLIYCNMNLEIGLKIIIISLIIQSDKHTFRFRLQQALYIKDFSKIKLLSKLYLSVYIIYIQNIQFFIMWVKFYFVILNDFDFRLKILFVCS